jgi:broad specificity phosphatase PhoE
MRPDAPATRERVADRLISALAPLDGVCSVRLVGSFWSAGSHRSAADVDVVVILDALNRVRFDACVAAVARLDGDTFGSPGAPVRVNSTFGPMKFGDGNDVVVHLMIYDRAGHRTHVLESPFTCLDWEREDRGSGPSLREHYAVPPLAPPALLSARRGVEDYVRDLDAGIVSVRRYTWDAAGAARTVVDRMPLDARNRGEFALHVVRHLLTNFEKVFSGRNAALSDDALHETWNALLPGTDELQDAYFRALAQKRTGALAHAERTLPVVRAFASAFGDALQHRINAISRVRFVRHAATTITDGTFLGQRRDPGIADASAVTTHADATSIDAVWTSPARRARETAARLVPARTPVIDIRAAEIDYGDAEGLDLSSLRERHPAIPAAWSRGDDPAFPGGESTGDVLARLDALLGDLPRSATDTLLVTHNVVLRTLIGSRLGVPMRRWHEIVVPYLAETNAYVMPHGIVLHLDRERLGVVLDLRNAA